MECFPALFATNFFRGLRSLIFTTGRFQVWRAEAQRLWLLEHRLTTFSYSSSFLLCDLVVTAYQSANGLVNFINPTFAVVVGGLAIGRVSYDRWLAFIWPLLLILILFITVVLSISTLL